MGPARASCSADLPDHVALVGEAAEEAACGRLPHHHRRGFSPGNQPRWLQTGTERSRCRTPQRASPGASSARPQSPFSQQESAGAWGQPETHSGARCNLSALPCVSVSLLPTARGGRGTHGGRGDVRGPQRARQPHTAESAVALPARGPGYSLASWNAAAMASSQHCDSDDIRGRPVSPKAKVSCPAASAAVATRLQARIMSNCTVKRTGNKTGGWLGLAPASVCSRGLTDPPSLAPRSLAPMGCHKRSTEGHSFRTCRQDHAPWEVRPLPHDASALRAERTVAVSALPHQAPACHCVCDCGPQVGRWPLYLAPESPERAETLGLCPPQVRLPLPITCRAASSSLLSVGG